MGICTSLLRSLLSTRCTSPGRILRSLIHSPVHSLNSNHQQDIAIMWSAGSQEVKVCPAGSRCLVRQERAHTPGHWNSKKQPAADGSLELKELQVASGLHFGEQQDWLSHTFPLAILSLKCPDSSLLSSALSIVLLQEASQASERMGLLTKESTELRQVCTSYPALSGLPPRAFVVSLSVPSAEEGGLKSSWKGDKRKTSWRRTTRKPPWSED